MTSLTKETQLTLLYILIAFSFSVAMRFIWVYHFQGVEAFHFNGQLMINTNDGYSWAEGARDLMSGVTQPNDLSSVIHAAPQLTAVLATILPFSFETVILYMPAFLSSLIVIPIILIAKDLKNLEMGLIAALLASIAWSYYNRTMVGYYDTDMLNIVLPMFFLWSIIWAIDTQKDIYLLITALDILVYRWWYPASYSLEFSFFGLIFLYTIIFDRKNPYNYQLLAIMILAMINLDGYIRFALVVSTYFLFKQEKFDKYVYYILGAAIIAFLVTGGFTPIWVQLSQYIFEDSIKASSSGMGLHFFSVMQTVREAGKIPFETFANRISGHTITFALSIIGYIYLAYRHKIMLFALPLIGLGFLASVGGLRFTVYAVPILAMGIAFLITEVSSKIPNKPLKYSIMALLTLAILYPNYKHIDGYKVPTVFNSTEVKVLTQLGEMADREDYVVTWWDYGYPIRYYSDVKTLVDGGKHSGKVNFPVSYILTNTQKEAANMARLEVEYTEQNFKKSRPLTNIENMTTDYGFTNTNDFLKSLKSDVKLPEKTRDIYLYLPFKMANIYPTVKLFSNMNLMNGDKFNAPFFYVSQNFQDTPDSINLGRGIVINKKSNSINIGKNNIPLKRFVTTKYDKQGNLRRGIQNANHNANLSVIFMSDYKKFVVVDEQTYNSLYVQLMILEDYDKNLFEKVIANPYAKVYKLKI